MVDQERVRLDQEKCRVQTLLQGMQNVMSAYNASGNPPTPTISAAVPAQPLVVVPQPRSFSGSPAGIFFPLRTLLQFRFCAFYMFDEIIWENLASVGYIV